MVKSILIIIASLLKYGSDRYSKQRSEGHGRNAAIAEAAKDVAAIMEDIAAAERNAIDVLRTDGERVLATDGFNRANAKRDRAKSDGGGKE